MITPIVTPAWHNSAALKAEVYARMLAHREEDSIIQGLYQIVDPSVASGYKGCLIGCTLPYRGGEKQPFEGWHNRVADLYAIPAGVGHLLDRVFENIAHDEAGPFALASIEAIPVGADLTLVLSRWWLDVLVDPEHGVVRHTAVGSPQRTAVETVATLHQRRLLGDEPARSSWVQAREKAWTARRVAVAAADAAADAVADAAARQLWWTWAADRLLHHLRTAPTAPGG